MLAVITSAPDQWTVTVEERPRATLGRGADPNPTMQLSFADFSVDKQSGDGENKRRG